MSARNVYALASLPMLDPPGTEPPLSHGELLARTPAGRARELVQAVLLSDDLLQRESWLGGELEQVRPCVLSEAEARGEAPLPSELLLRSDDPGRDVPADRVWEGWVRWVVRLAARRRSPFLRRWIGADVAIRNGLTRLRARALRLDAERWLVAEDLEEESPEVDQVIARWKAAPDPLQALHALLEARWALVDRVEPWFSFDDDELPAYAAKLVLCYRWWRTRDGGRS